MTNRGVVGPATPGTRFAGLGDLSAATYGSEPVWNPATNSYVLQKGSKYDPKSSTYNVSDSSLRRWKAQLSKALTSNTPASIVCIGDSITEGSVGTTPFRTSNWAARLRSAMAADGRAGVVGEGASFNTGQTPSTYDERWVLGTGWSRGSGGLINQSIYGAAAGTAGTLSFTLPSCDTIYIYYLQHSIEGTWTYKIDGGSPVSVNANGATALIKSAPISVTAGTHTIAFTAPPVTGFAGIAGIGWATSTAPNDVEVYTGGGQLGYTTNSALLENTNATGFSMLTMMDLLKPDLSIVCLGRNDADSNNHISTAAFIQNYTNFIQRMRVTNQKDVLIVTPPPADPQAYALNTQMRQALYSMADSLDVALVDLDARFGPAWNTAPYNMSADNIHPNDAGSQQFAQTIANVLLNV